MIEQRIARVRTLMQERGYDGLVVRNNADLRWLTGAEKVFDFETAHTAFITQTQLLFHTDSRYFNTFAERLGGDTPWVFDEEWVGHERWIAERVAQTQVRSLALEDSMSLRMHRNVVRALEDRSLAPQIALLGNDLTVMRSIKDEQELCIMREAQAITDAAFEHMLGYIEPGRTEKELQVELESYMYHQGADGLAFGSIVAVGPNAANPHALPGDRKVTKGQFVLMDYGASKRDYCSDMTRTVMVGQANDEQRLIYQTVLEAHQAAAAFIKPGVKGSACHEVAAKVIDQAGYGDKFSHGLGHGVGIEIHELPNLGRTSENLLEIGSVVTDEPGIYLPGNLGVRIEDTGVVTATGFDPFPQAPKHLIEL